jgi:putative endonuclease
MPSPGLSCPAREAGVGHLLLLSCPAREAGVGHLLLLSCPAREAGVGHLRLCHAQPAKRASGICGVVARLSTFRRIDVAMNAAVYILTSRNRAVLYVGVTSNLVERVRQHKSKAFPGFTRSYNVEELVYVEVFPDIRDAIFREKMIKKKSRRGKVRLIESINPVWRDLSLDLV